MVLNYLAFAVIFNFVIINLIFVVSVKVWFCEILSNMVNVNMSRLILNLDLYLWVDCKLPHGILSFHIMSFQSFISGWVGLWGFLWWAPSAKRKDHHGVSSGWSSVWHRSNTGLSCTQYEQIPIILGVWPFWLTPFFFWSIRFWRAYD